MFLRFRTIGRFLHVALVDNKRIDGKVRQRTLETIGSVTTDPPNDDSGWNRAWPWVIVEDRTAIWKGLHEAIAGHRIEN